MSNEDSSAAGFSAGMAPMMAFAEAMNRNWMEMAWPGGFPGGDAPGQSLGGDTWKDAVEKQMQMAAISWKGFSDIMSGSAEGVWAEQDDLAERMSKQMAAAVRSFTGIDPNAMMAGAIGDWSPETVAFQSFGLTDADAAAYATEMAQLAISASEMSRTMFHLSRIVNNAWVDAAESFAEGSIEDQPDLSDPSALQREWLKTAEPILQERLASDEFVKANAEFIRAGASFSKARSAFARRFTDLIEAPNRQEMSEAYEAIQELRREVRSLRRNQKRLEQALAEKE